MNELKDRIAELEGQLEASRNTSRLLDAECKSLLAERNKFANDLNIAYHALRVVSKRKTIGDEFDARKAVAAALKSINMAAMPNDQALRPEGQ